MRQISNDFIRDLIDEDGLLYPIFRRIKLDDTLIIAIRKNYINIYYRGGNIIKISEKNSNGYNAYFDKDYMQYSNARNKRIDLPENITTKQDSKTWEINIQTLKEHMDAYFSFKPKCEKEHQQLIFKENNSSRISNATEYFISDIEYQERLDSRFDMLACKWLASERQDETKIKPAIIEIKYGESSIDGSAGLKKHLTDISNIISDNNKYHNLLDEMESQINQLNQLEQLRFNENKNFDIFKIDKLSRPEVIFVLSNYNPRSLKTLKDILNSQEIQQNIIKDNFDLKFYVSTFSGYAMHSHCMWKFHNFNKLLDYMIA